MRGRFLVVGLSRNVEIETDQDQAVTRQNDTCIRDKISVAISACDSAAKQYDDYAKSFIALDVKAQATTVISGLVLASIAAFVKDGRVAALHDSRWWILLILAAPVAALSGVVISVLGSHIREVIVPFDAPAQIHDIQNLTSIDCTEFSPEHVLLFHRERLTHWSEALKSIVEVTETKAMWVARGQMR